MIRAAVLGSPISHSLSPRLHTAAYRYLGIVGDYISFDVPSGTLQNFLSDKDSAWTGFSLTMPLKEEALECAAVIDPLVRKIGCGNTLVKNNGEWNLFSTDVVGFRNSWKDKYENQPSSVLIIGSGATARAAAAAFDDENTQIQILHRNMDRKVSMQCAATKSSLQFQMWNEKVDFKGFDLVINTTPKFALDELSKAIESETHGVFFDVIYDPWPTEFAKIWSLNGGKVISGLELLIAQGVEQVKIFTGLDVSTESLTAALKKEFDL